MYMYMNGTCVSFRQRQPYDRAYVQIAKSTSGECSSNVGMVTARGTVGVSRTVLSSNCTNIGSILHELGHVLGRYHEHSRLDRDNYVEILYQNIYAYAISNFFIYFDTNTPIAYDYNSIMHYDSRAYSMNGLDTIRTLHNISTVMGQRLYLTEHDYANINFMYNCTHFLSTIISPTTSHVHLVSGTSAKFTHPNSAVHPHPCGAVAYVTFSAVHPFGAVATGTASGTALGTQWIVLTSQPQAPLAFSTPKPVAQTPPPVYSQNSQGCICHICMYKVLLYLFFVFLY